MDELTAFFQEQRQRVLKPSSEFCGRVIWRLSQERLEEESKWDSLLAASSRTLAAALACLLALIGLDIMAPPEPGRGLTQIYLESDLSRAEQFLYLELETPPTIVLQELISIDDQ